MLSSDQNIQTIRELVLNLKEYAELKAESVQIGIIRKLSILITARVCRHNYFFSFRNFGVGIGSPCWRNSYILLNCGHFLSSFRMPNLCKANSLDSQSYC